MLLSTWLRSAHPLQAQAIFRRAQLKAVMDIHAIDSGLGGDLSEDEITIIRGALDLSNKTAVQCMTPIDKVAACSGCFTAASCDAGCSFFLAVS